MIRPPTRVAAKETFTSGATPFGWWYVHFLRGGPDALNVLSGAGIGSSSYLPQNSYRVYASGAQMTMVAAATNAYAARVYPAASKLSPSFSRYSRLNWDIVAVLPSAADRTSASDSASAGTAASRIATAAGVPVGSVTISTGFTGSSLALVRGVANASSAATAVAALFDVAHVEPVDPTAAFLSNTFAEAASVQTDPVTAVSDVAPLWSLGYWGHGQRLALADVGVDNSTCQLSGRVAWSPIGGADGSDATGHGTHVASLICGLRSTVAAAIPCLASSSGGPAPPAACSGVSASNVTGAYAAAQEAQQSDVESLGAAPAATATVLALGAGAKLTPATIAALLPAASTASGGAGVVLGVGVPAQTPAAAAALLPYGVVDAEFDAYAAANPAFLPIAACGGQGGLGDSTVASPALAKSVVAVGAVDDRGFLLAASSRGPAADGRVKPDVLALGANLVGARSGVACGARTASGSSAAVPIAAGGVALLRQWLAAGGYARAGAIAAPPAAALRAIILAAANPDGVGVEVTASTGDAGGASLVALPLATSGYGVLRLASVAAPSGAGKFWANIASADSATVTEAAPTVDFCFAVAAGGSERLRVALAWTDAAGDPTLAAEAPQLRNDLDLFVWDSKGGAYKGNGGGAGGAFDAVNTAEVVDYPQGIAGRYRVRVMLGGRGAMRGARTSAGLLPQTFYLAVTGRLSGDVLLASSPSAQCPTGCPASCSGAVAASCPAAGGDCTCPSTLAGPDCSFPNAGYGGGDDGAGGASCPSPRCGGHGCWNGTACACFQSARLGFFAGATCGQCAAGYTGASCLASSATCAAAGNTAWAAVGDSACARGECVDASFAGEGCAVCSGTFAPPRSCKCADPVCGGHGECAPAGGNGYCLCVRDLTSGNWGAASERAVAGDATTQRSCSRCQEGWAGPTCLCKNDTAAGVCGGKGTCGAAGCVCFDDDERGHWALGSQTCGACAAGWTGPQCRCETAGGVACSGHGACNATTGVCSCNDDAANGHWATANPSGQKTNCGRCAPFWQGAGGSDVSGCRCSFQLSGSQRVANCSGHGVCAAGGCVCSQTDADGYWAGEQCNQCAAAYAGPGLSVNTGCMCARWGAAAGGALECSGHGVCEAKGCRCNQTALTGFFEATTGAANCGRCKASYSDPAGSAGLLACRCFSECSGHGKCTANGCVCAADAGVWGPPASQADPGPVAGVYAACSECAAGFGPAGRCVCNSTDATQCATRNVSVGAAAATVDLVPGTVALRFSATTLAGMPAVVGAQHAAYSTASLGEPVAAQRVWMGRAGHIFVTFASAPAVGRRQSAAATSLCGAGSVQLTTPLAITATTGVAEFTAAGGSIAAFTPGSQELWVLVSAPGATQAGGSSAATSAWYPADTASCSAGGAQSAAAALKATADAAAGETSVTGGVCCLPVLPAQQLGNRTVGVTYALFATPKEDKLLTTPRIIGGAVGLFLLVVVAVVVTLVCLRFHAREKHLRRARERAVQFLLRAKDGHGGLRSALHLPPGQRFTTGLAAARIQAYLAKAHAIAARVASGPAIHPTTGLLAQPAAGAAAVRAILTSGRDFRQPMMLQAGDPLVDCARRVRGMFVRDPQGRYTLRADALPPAVQSLVVAQMAAGDRV